MLFKEKLLLSNCDSVRQLDPEELRKRVLTGLAFADGVVLSPNAVIDNLEILQVLSQLNVVRYLNEEGYGKLVIRGFGVDKVDTVVDYYESLPDSYIISSLPGTPCKGELDRYERQVIKERLAELQELLYRLKPSLQGLELPRESLRNEVLKRLQSADLANHYFSSPEAFASFKDNADQVISRSEWYQYAQGLFAEQENAEQHFAAFRAEVIDPAYNSLFAVTNEGFLQDDIRLLSGVPEMVLDTSIAIRSMRKEISLVKYPLKVFEFISSFGSGEVARYLTDEAIGYIEDKMISKGHTYMTRKNWFGMYPRMRRFMGLEIK